MRTLSTDMANAVAAGTLAPFYFVALQFDSGTKYVSTLTGTVTWNTHDWAGQGDLLGVSPITQTGDLNAEGITLTLSGMATGLVTSAMTDVSLQNTVDVWLGFLNLTTGAIIVNPVQCFAGHLDVPTMQDDGEKPVISFTAENDLLLLSKASQRRYTNDDQQIDYPTDTGFQYVPWVQLWNGAWGGAGGRTVAGGTF
jgi:hypothetical protein